MKSNFSITEYINQQPVSVQALLHELNKKIKEWAPEATEKISYGIPTYHLFGNLVHFAAYKNHIGFYPAPTAIEKFKNRLSNYKVSKGAIQFKLDDELPFSLLEEIVKFRINENISKNKNL